MKIKLFLMLFFILATLSLPALATDNVINIQLTLSSSNDGPTQDGKDPVTPNQFSATLNNHTLMISTSLDEIIQLHIKDMKTKEEMVNMEFSKSVSYSISKGGSYKLTLQVKNIILEGLFEVEISQKEAADIVLKMYENENVEIFVSNTIYSAGDTVHVAYEQLYKDYIIVKNRVWIAFVDLYPDANWAHDCIYILIDAYSKDVTIYESDRPLKNKDLFKQYKFFNRNDNLKVINQQEAYSIVDSIYKANTVRIYISNDFYHGGETFDLPNTDVVRVPYPLMMYWIAFVDLYPMESWEHPCEYVFINAYTKHITTITKTMLPKQLQELFTLKRWDNKKNDSGLISPTEIITSHKNVAKSPHKNNSYDAPTRILTNENYHKWAIIISGGYNSNENWVRYWNDCSAVYKTLLNNGFLPDQIFVAISDGLDADADMHYNNGSHANSPWDLDGNGTNDTQFSATREDIEELFNTVRNTITPGDEIFIFTTDHGGLFDNNSVLWLWNEEYIYDYEFANLVESLNAGIVNIVMEQCHSGGFIDDFYGSNFNQVVITTACSPEQLSWSRNEYYDEFIYWWCTAVNGITPDSNIQYNADLNSDNYISMQEAYIFASAHDERNETPMQHSNDNCLPTALTLTQILDICDNYTLISGYDIYIKDNAADFGFEPNITTNESWIAPNIWFEDLNGNKVNTLYQGQTYKINTRIYNRGDQASPGGETIYWHWTKAMIGGSWPHSWFEQYEYTCGQNSVIRGALINPEGTTIPSINGGDSYVASEYWTVPVIDYSACAEFADDIDQLWHYCIMARIIDAQSQPGEDMAEQTLTSIVLDNNNVASCNFSIFNNQNLSNDSIPAAIVGLTAPNMITGYYHIYCDLLSSNIDLGNNIHIYLTLSSEMYNNWSMNGNGYSDINGQGKLEITSNHAELLDVYMNGNGLYPIKIELDNTNSLNTEVSFDIYLVNNNGDIIGGERFKYYGNGVNYYETIPYRQYGEESSSNQIIVNCSPNPAETNITITASEEILSIYIYNTQGHIVLSSNDTTINIAHLPKGLYMVQAKTLKGDCQTKFVKQ